MEKKKILVIEDEKGMREAMADTFENAGYQVFLAEDGEQGIQMTQKNNPDLIMLDIILPKKDGFEVLQAIKSDKKTQNIPVILCTNLSETEDIQKALDLGATTYLVKSNYSLADVLSKAEEVLKNS